MNLYLDGRSLEEINKWLEKRGPYLVPKAIVSYRIKLRYGLEKFKLMQRDPSNRRKIADM